MSAYTVEQRVEALSLLEANGGNVKRTATELGIPRATLIMWRDKGVEAVSVDADTKKTEEWADLFGHAARLGAKLIADNLARYEGRDLKPSELRDVAVVSGIAVDKHLDYRDGRKGSQVNVSANAQAGVVIQRNTRGLNAG